MIELAIPWPRDRYGATLSGCCHRTSARIYSNDATAASPFTNWSPGCLSRPLMWLLSAYPQEWRAQDHSNRRVLPLSHRRVGEHRWTYVLPRTAACAVHRLPYA